MTENQNTEGQEVQAEKAPPREIIRGRMPVAVVHMVRYGSSRELSTKQKADAFGTTVGKIDDIVKGRNFAYVTEDFRPTEQQKADAVAWLTRHPYGADDLLAELDQVPVATAEEAAAFEASRTAARGQSPKTAEGDDANAGGGNRRKRKGKASEEQAADGDALLS